MICAFLTVCHDKDGDGKNEAGDSSDDNSGNYDGHIGCGDDNEDSIGGDDEDEAGQSSGVFMIV